MSEKIPLHVYEKAKKRANIVDNIGSGIVLTVCLIGAGLTVWGIWTVFSMLATTPLFWPFLIGAAFLALVITTAVLSTRYNKIVDQGEKNGIIDE